MDKVVKYGLLLVGGVSFFFAIVAAQDSSPWFYLGVGGTALFFSVIANWAHDEGLGKPTTSLSEGKYRVLGHTRIFKAEGEYHCLVQGDKDIRYIVLPTQIIVGDQHIERPVLLITKSSGFTKVELVAEPEEPEPQGIGG